MHIRTTAVTLATLFVAATAGCHSSQAPSSASGGGDQSPRLMGALANYQLPPSSVPPTHNADPDVDAAIGKMAGVAANQGLTFDGSRADQGIVVVGRQGRGGPMLLAVSVYNKGGRVAVQDTSKAGGLDYREAQQMRNQFLDAL